MDEFSWFVGLYEGEGTLVMNGGRWPNMCLKLDMTDEDTIARAAKFLGVSYRAYGPYGSNKKKWYRTKKQGGRRSGLYDLLMKMKPHLSKRRQAQIETTLDKYQ